MTLRSNTIEFDVILADVESGAKEFQEATAIYQTTTTEPCDYRAPHECAAAQAARRLRFLSSKQSTTTLAKLFWSLNDQPGGWDLIFGLFGSPYRLEAIGAMEREIRNPDHPITQDFLQMFTKLQVAAEAPGSPPENDPAGFQKWREGLHQMEAHARDVKKASIAATVAALPRKTGRAHTLTLVTLATDKSDLLDKKAESQLRRQLIAEWDDLPEKTKEDLIQQRWPPLTEPEALPILREIVSQPAADFGIQGSGRAALAQPQCSAVMSRNWALKRIFELEPAEGRSLILRDLSDPQAAPSVALIKLLSSKDLRPVVQRAVQRVESHDDPWTISKTGTWDYSIIELFADKSALGSLEAKFNAYNDHLSKGRCVVYAAPMLRYFLRVDPKVGTREVQASLAARKVTGCYTTLLEDLGPSLPKLEQLAISDLDDADLKVSTSAARALQPWGTAKAEPALWARLTRFHQEWPTGAGELPLTDDHDIQGTNGPVWVLARRFGGRTREVHCKRDKLDLRSGKIPAVARVIFSAALVRFFSLDRRMGGGEPWILNPTWDPEDALTFSLLQYSNLDGEQIRTKLSQLQRGSKLYFQTYTAEQMGAPVSMERQHALLQELRKYAAQFGVTIEERPRYKVSS